MTDRRNGLVRDRPLSAAVGKSWAEMPRTSTDGAPRVLWMDAVDARPSSNSHCRDTVDAKQRRGRFVGDWPLSRNVAG
jgi:hypothetical protein